jgi:NitT/TauT family transport system substrate-binding protein
MKRRDLLGSLAAAGIAAAATPVRAQEAALRLAAPPTDASGEYFYANEVGFFKRNGLSAEIAHLTNGEAVTAGVIGGSIDIGVGQSISVIVAHTKGLPVTVLAGSVVNSSAAETGVLFVPNGSTASSGKDLIGKTIGVQGLRGFAQYGTMAWLDKSGGDSSTNKFVEMTSSVMGRALQEGRLDAAFIPEPFVSQIAQIAKRVTTPMDAVAPRFMAGAHFATLPWANAHRAEIKRFLAAIYATAAWANKNHDKTAEMLARAALIDPETVRHAVRAEYVERPDPGLLQPMINLAAKYGGITPFPAEELFFKA